MATVPQAPVLGLESAGVHMTPEDFDAVEDWDENYRYELVNGVLVVKGIPLAEETGPNELLGSLLLNYQEDHPQGRSLDHTLPQQYVRTRTSRRIADRLIWAGMGRMPNRRRDPPNIAVEFVSAGSSSHQRDYVNKKKDYRKARVSEYWIIDRFQRTLTVFRYTASGVEVLVIHEHETYESPLLPGFHVPLARLLAAADRWAEADSEESRCVQRMRGDL